ncbi:MAG TPA: fibronectin type III domain-containing protein [Candidatus Binataceae bacterium]|nr:fibronectin type III domain-containing protein [Candidatus Binataceae bacterium]
MMKRLHLAIIAVMAVLSSGLCAGCGVKSAPIPPQYAKPQKILDLEAVNDKDGVRLTWRRPDQYVGGAKLSDLGGFTLSRTEVGSPSKEIAQVNVTDQGRFQVQHIFTYKDTATTVGKTYHYQVVALTTDGYRSDPSNDATIMRKLPTPPPNPENYVLPSPVPLP